MRKALMLGIFASAFFAFTFIFNRSMNLGGGYWLWTGSLRYFFTLPMMLILVWKEKGITATLKAIGENPGKWILWSTVGFGLFYFPLTWASVFGESWFVAATWQITIVCGVFLTTLFGKRIPVKNLLFSALILVGIALLQTGHIASGGGRDVVLALLLILIGAVSYPLGNRKMMLYCPDDLTTSQRVFGMTLCSMPFWLITAVIAGLTGGAPAGNQLIQSAVVALFAGVIATVLFFEATNLVRGNMKQLAVIEATQSGEVIFTLIGGILVLGDGMPSAAGFLGILIIVAGMIGNSLCTTTK